MKKSEHLLKKKHANYIKNENISYMNISYMKIAIHKRNNTFFHFKKMGFHSMLLQFR